MWLMTKHGFYSIVQKEEGMYHVRSRERSDIENLIKGASLNDAPVQESRQTDYAVRIVVGRKDLDKIMAFLGTSIDYPNFKDEIDASKGQSHKPYHEIWKILADALGSYGRTGRIKGD